MRWLAVAVVLTTCAACGSAKGRPRLAPPTASIDRVWRIGASGGEPRQMLVEWHARERVAPQGGPPRPLKVWRLTLWTSGAHGWKAFSVLASDTSLDPIDSLLVTDVTHDRHPDVLVHDVQGNTTPGLRASS